MANLLRPFHLALELLLHLLATGTVGLRTDPCQAWLTAPSAEQDRTNSETRSESYLKVKVWTGDLRAAKLSVR